MTCTMQPARAATRSGLCDEVLNAPISNEALGALILDNILRAQVLKEMTMSVPKKVQEQIDAFCQQTGQMWATVGTVRDVLEDQMEETHVWRETQDFLDRHGDDFIIFPS